jgi:hypothetical protein
MFLEAIHGQNISPTSGIVEFAKVSPAENFEKVLVSFNYQSCS